MQFSSATTKCLGMHVQSNRTDVWTYIQGCVLSWTQVWTTEAMLFISFHFECCLITLFTLIGWPSHWHKVGHELALVKIVPVKTYVHWYFRGTSCLQFQSTHLKVSCKMSVNLYEASQHHISQESNLITYCYEKLNSHNVTCDLLSKTSSLDFCRAS